jgi:hypothetical protein
MLITALALYLLLGFVCTVGIVCACILSGKSDPTAESPPGSAPLDAQASPELPAFADHSAPSEATC